MMHTQWLLTPAIIEFHPTMVFSGIWSWAHWASPMPPHLLYMSISAQVTKHLHLHLFSMNKSVTVFQQNWASIQNMPESLPQMSRTQHQKILAMSLERTGKPRNNSQHPQVFQLSYSKTKCHFMTFYQTVCVHQSLSHTLHALTKPYSSRSSPILIISYLWYIWT